MTNTFNYTEGGSVRSSAVDEVYYDADTETLLVVLHGQGYVYDGVPASAYRVLLSGWGSIGRKYAKDIKGNYGPGENWGYVEDFDVIRRSFEAVPMESVATPTPKGLTLAPDAKVTGARIDLAPATAGTKPLRLHTVVFESGGNTHTHQAYQSTVDEAVDNLDKIAKALNREFKVREVVVSFA